LGTAAGFDATGIHLPQLQVRIWQGLGAFRFDECYSSGDKDHRKDGGYFHSPLTLTSSHWDTITARLTLEIGPGAGCQVSVDAG